MPPARTPAAPAATGTATDVAGVASSVGGAAGASVSAAARARRRRGRSGQFSALKRRFDDLEPAAQGAAVAGASLALFLGGAVFGWLRRRSAEAASSDNAAARDAYVRLQGQAATSKLASLSFTAQAERASLLSKHSVERAAAESERVAAEKAAARRLNELQSALAATQALLQEKEATLAAVWAAKEALESGAAAVLRRELDVLRAMQIKDARAASVARVR